MRLFLLTDGSVSPKLSVGFGAYLVYTKAPETLGELRGLIKVKKFENTSSTKLELQTLLWALSEISEREVISYTDSQNIVGLLSRKEKLIGNSYCSKSGKRIRNHELYREFFESIEKFDIQFHLLSGHKPSRSKGHIDEVFSFVDRASRHALRAYSKSNFQQAAGGKREDL